MFSGTSNSFAFTAAVDSIICVDVYREYAGTVTGCTYNSQALTEVFQGDLSSGGVRAAAVCYIGIAGIDGASHNVVLTASIDVSPWAFAARVSSWLGVERGTVAATHRTIYSAGDGGGGAGVNVTVVDSQAGDVVKSMSASSSGVLALVDTTVGLNTNIGGSTSDLGVQYRTATGASEVVSFTGDAFCTNVAYALVPASVVSPVIGRRIYVLP